MSEGGTIVEAAEALAYLAHAGQRYGDPPDDRPYDGHCQDVVEVLVSFGHKDPELLAAGWLHDALEDTDLDPAKVERQCGPRVLALVRAVTDSLGVTRAERKAATLPRIREAGRDAVAIKLADRIANVSECLRTSDTRRLDMYRAEGQAFHRALYDTKDGLYPMWVELRSLLGSRWLLDPL